MKDIKIIVAAHKKYDMPDNNLYLPVFVGADGKEDISGYKRDDTGSNISIKNPNFCELTGLYWAWKNVDEDYIYYRFKGYGSDNDNGIYRIKKDGTDNTLIYAPKDLSMVSEISPIMLKNNWLYFYKPFYDSTGVKELCRVKNDGSKVESIYTFENKKEYIDDYNNILNDKFFWSSVIYSEDDVLDSYDMGYKISLDGKNKAEIGSTTIYDYALNDKFIKKIKDGNFVKFEIYDNQDNKISTLE